MRYEINLTILMRLTSSFSGLCHGSIVASLSPRRPEFDPRSVRVIFVVDRVSLGQVALPVLQFPLSVSFHQCSIIFCILMLLLPRAEAGEAWEPVWDVKELWRESKLTCCAGSRTVERKQADMLCWQ